MRRTLAAAALALPACGAELVPAEHEEALRVCADGPTESGIDVSKWQGSIDWDAVAGAGVKFAFIRVNHGLGDLDEKFAVNWAEARRVGVLRGAYQYFIPSEDAVEQADLLLEKMGPLEDDDLPPVLDVEEAAGQTKDVIIAKIHQWMDRVEPVVGRKPILYTAKYFWQDGVGRPADFLDHPLWVANYNVTCPLMAEPWARWDFWQRSSTGSVPGIAGDVDLDVFNGDMNDLMSFTVGAWACEYGHCAPRAAPGAALEEPAPPSTGGGPPGGSGEPAPAGCEFWGGRGRTGAVGVAWALAALALVSARARGTRRRSSGPS